MAALIDGEFLNRYLSPQLLFEYRNTEDTFTKFFGKVNKKAVTSDGVSVQKILNDIQVKFGLSKTAKLTPRELNGKKGVVPWMNFTTEVLEFDEEELRALAFDKKSVGRQLLKEAVLNAVLKMTLYSIAPDSDATNTPIFSTTGANDGTGRLMLQPKDVTGILRKLDIKDPVCVLNRNHLIDLQEHESSANRFKDMIINQRDMKPIPYAGVNFASTDMEIRYTDAGVKKAIDALPAGTDKLASVFIDKTNTMYYLNKLMFTLSPATTDNENEIPKTQMRIYGNFIGAVIEDDRRRAAIIDG